MFGFKHDDAATVVQFIAEQVRRDISFGVLPPDSRLKIEDLRQRYGGSAHSFREALTLLANEGIVEANTQRGFRVASASQADLEDVTRLRAEIEGLGLKWSMKHGAVRWEGELIAARHAVDRADQMVMGDIDALALEWDEANREFHAVLVSRCNSPRLIEFQSRLFFESRRFRFAVLKERGIVPEELTMTRNRLVDAVLARNEQRAIEALERLILEPFGNLGI
ncbi:GntR family transcriptional regulator [Hoeflea sp. AS16]|uniref:GntR family transcriptional regulator n=1 Tax=Hoeflea sp. AS16 TaxID=3135779 RepID=UPI00317076AC